MTMYVVKVGTNVKTADPDYADSDRFDFYGRSPARWPMSWPMRCVPSSPSTDPRSSSTATPWSRSLASPPTPPTGHDAVARFLRDNGNHG